MPLTDKACPNCSGRLHTDDLLEGRCITPGCGANFDRGLGDRDDLPDYSPEADNPEDDGAKIVTDHLSVGDDGNGGE